MNNGKTSTNNGQFVISDLSGHKIYLHAILNNKIDYRIIFLNYF